MNYSFQFFQACTKVSDGEELSNQQKYRNLVQNGHNLLMCGRWLTTSWKILEQIFLILDPSLSLTCHTQSVRKYCCLSVFKIESKPFPPPQETQLQATITSYLDSSNSLLTDFPNCILTFFWSVFQPDKVDHVKMLVICYFSAQKSFGVAHFHKWKPETFFSPCIV